VFPELRAHGGPGLLARRRRDGAHEVGDEDGQDEGEECFAEDGQGDGEDFAEDGQGDGEDFAEDGQGDGEEFFEEVSSLPADSRRAHRDTPVGRCRARLAMIRRGAAGRVSSRFFDSALGVVLVMERVLQPARSVQFQLVKTILKPFTGDLRCTIESDKNKR
jgi:hypothetical protein